MIMHTSQLFVARLRINFIIKESDLHIFEKKLHA
jgi:hypothetical protein